MFTTVYADRTEADRVYWKDISNIEYVKNTLPRPFEVAVVTAKGARFVYMQGDEPLEYQAVQLGDSIKRPVITRDEAGGPDVANKQ